MLQSIAERLCAVALIVGAYGLGLGCSAHPSTEQCQKLLVHVVDLQIEDGGENKDMSPEMKADLEKQKQKLTAFVRDEFMRNCTEELPASFATCALAADSMAKYADCTKTD